MSSPRLPNLTRLPGRANLRARAKLRRRANLRRPTTEHLLLGLIVAASGLLSSWNIGYAGYSTFYSTAARSMTVSWRAFAFGAFDPGAHMTLDKLAGFLIPQALAARLFGFHPWSIALPQVIEGMVTVLACYLIARRWRGPAAGVLAAATAATTPLLLSMFGHVMEDGLLTMSLALAFLCWQSALRRHRWSSLLLCAFWVAVGFQAKMMQSWIILPALAAGYLVGAPGPLPRRVARGMLTGAVALGLSLSWMTAIQLVPAADRPYIDGSTNNNVYSMVFGFNGINRLLPNLVPGAIGDAVNSTRSPTPVTRATDRPLTPPAAPRPLNLPPGRRTAKLVLPYYATQVGWLYPAVLAGLLAQAVGLARWWRRGQRPRLSEAERASAGTAIAMAAWLLLSAGLLTVADIPHVAYLATIAVQLAVLAGIGLADAARRLHAGSRAARWALPALLAVQAGWVTAIMVDGRRGPRWLVPAVLLLAGGLLLTLVLGRRHSTEPRWRRPVLAAAALVVLLAPATWSGFMLDRNRDGTAGEAYVDARSRLTQHRPFRIDLPYRLPPDPRLSAAQRRLIGYLHARTGRRGPLMVTDQWTSAASYILAGGADVMTMGGFSGHVPSPTLAQLRQLIARDRGLFVLLTVRDALTAHNRTVQQDASWVRSHCPVVNPNQFGGPSHSLLGLRLYACYS